MTTPTPPFVAPMRKARLALGLLAITVSFTALAADGRWTRGFGQGNLEYFMEAKGMRLYIGCPTQDGSADAFANVSLYAVETQKEVPAFTVKVNGNTYRGPFEAGSRVDSDNFRSLLEDLRSADAVVRFGKKSITFPKANADKVIPATGTVLPCNVLF